MAILVSLMVCNILLCSLCYINNKDDYRVLKKRRNLGAQKVVDICERIC